MKKNNDIGVILPVSFPNQLERLDRSLLSLVGQILRPDRIYLVCTPDILEPVKKIVTSYQDYDLAVQILLSDSDELASLLSIGLTQAKERYIAFLQDGDFLYSTAYQSLKEKVIEGEKIGIAFSEILWFECEVYNGMDYKKGRRTKPALGGKSWLDYYSQCSFHSCLFDRVHCKIGEWHFNLELSNSWVFTDFLTRNGYLSVKNTENHNIPVGEKWFIKDQKEPQSLSKFDKAYQTQWDDPITENESRNFVAKRRKKKKIGLLQKVIHTCRYWKYRLLKG